MPKYNKYNFIIKNSLGGVAIYNYHLSKRLNNSKLIAVTYPKSNPLNLSKLLVSGFSEVKWDWKNKLSVNTKAVGKKCIPVGVMVANDLPELITYCQLKLSTPLVYILHGDYDFYYELALKFSPVIDKFFCVSQRIETKLLSSLPQRKNDIHLLYAPLVEEVFPRDFDSLPVQPKIVFVGRDTESKGFSTLFDLDNELRKRKINARWKLCCPSFSPKNLDKINAKPNFDYFIGLSPKEIKEIHKTCQFIILPSKAEGMPLSIVEGMEMGLVPIASNLPTLRELISENEGYLCKDDSDYIDAIESYFSDKPSYIQKSKNSQRKVLSCFNFKKNQSIFLEIVNSIETKASKDHHLIKIGSGLDKMIFPPVLVYFIRFFKSKLKWKKP